MRFEDKAKALLEVAIVVLAQTVMLILKLTGVIAWKWVWVLAPLWIWIIWLAVSLVIIMVFALKNTRR